MLLYATQFLATKSGPQTRSIHLMILIELVKRKDLRLHPDLLNLSL